jgi:NADH-quinone oxidoreductase subunit G
MAAVASSETVKIQVNSIELDVPKGEIIVESVKRLGLEIPIFCYHARMKPVGMCRMCLVEVGFTGPDGSVKMMPKPQAACTLPASEGMVVITDSELVHKDRRGVLEFLLINHPLDCPICDRGGECPLQNNTIFYGPSTSRFVEVKRHLPKAFPLSKYVTLDLERCIQCGRCVRFTEEISGDSQLAFRFRGANMTPSTFELTDFQSKFSGNVIEICPVGALTNAEYRFRARPWDLETKPGICTVCSNGCAVWFDYRVGKLSRINGRTNEQVNEEWTCDRGKFGHGFYNDPKRLKKPLIRRGDALVETEWPEVYGAILEAFSSGGKKIAALAGPMLSNEAYYLLQKLFRQRFGSNNSRRCSRGSSAWRPGTPPARSPRSKAPPRSCSSEPRLPTRSRFCSCACARRGSKTARTWWWLTTNRPTPTVSPTWFCATGRERRRRSQRGCCDCYPNRARRRSPSGLRRRSRPRRACPPSG